MKELQIFKNEEFGEIRTIEIDNEPWFVAKDVCIVLGYKNISKAILDHIEEEDKLSDKTLLSLGQRGGWIINESGLYSLVLRSHMPTAKEFKKWVTSEVLPTIRKTGGYLNPDSGIDWSDLDNIQKVLDVAKEEKRKRIEAENINIENKPKVEFYEAVTGSSDTVEMKEVAKILNIDGLGRNNLFTFLRNKKVLDRNNQPYQRFVDMGYFRLIESKYYVLGEVKINTKTVVYQKGIDYIKKLIDKSYE